MRAEAQGGARSTKGLPPFTLAFALALGPAVAGGDARAQLLPGLGSEESVRAIVQATTVRAQGLAGPRGLLVAPSGDMYVAEQASGSVARVAPDGAVTRISGFKQPRDVAMDARGYLFVADTGNNRIAVVPFDGKTGAWGKPATWVSGVRSPVDIAFNAAGELLVCENGASRVLAFAAPDKRRVVVSGFRPHGLAFGADGALYVTDLTNRRVVKVGAKGEIEVIATDAGVPIGVAVGQSGDLYIAQRDAGKVIRLTKAGKRLTVLDRLNGPRDPVFDAAGNLHVAETGTGRVLKLEGRF